MPDLSIQRAPLHCPCSGKNFSKVFTYAAPPVGEIRFHCSSDGDYYREVLRCAVCAHFVSVHNMNMSDLYQSDYVSSTYGDGGLRRAFERVTSLDPAKSDNVGRVQRVLAFASVHLTAPATEHRAPSVLDVGSGICVFPHRMQAAGWECTALDPDIRAVTHAREVVGVKAICGDFLHLQDLGRFDVVTFNKVLEHVEDPVAMLAKSASHLRAGGFVYVEVPDGEAAVVEGPGREEFFIDHNHVFSIASLALLATRSGFSVRTIERIREPSSKYTLRAFLSLT